MFELFNELMNKLFDKDVEEYDLIQETTSRIEEIDDEELSEIYDSLSNLGKRAIDSYSHDYADATIGDSSWREGTDFEE